MKIKICSLGKLAALGLILGGAINQSVQAAEPSAGTEGAYELAMQLANPIAALISVPFQLNYDTNIGPADDGDRWTLNIQPVVPFSIGEEWNVISRTIVPVIVQDDIFPGAGSQSGISDIVQSLFFSPKTPTSGGLIWGIGPVFLFPSGSDDLLTADKWGAGPTGVVLKQRGPWTFGALANHIWSYAGEEERPDVNATFLQPFVSYTTSKAISITGVSESTYNWDSEQWSVPLGLVVTKVTRIGNQALSFGGGIRYWAESPDSGPEGWAGRLVLTFMFPR